METAGVQFLFQFLGIDQLDLHLVKHGRKTKKSNTDVSSLVFRYVQSIWNPLIHLVLVPVLMNIEVRVEKRNIA